MLKSELPSYAKTVLKHLLHRHGEVIYSSHETLKEGDVYLMGMNPGGAGFITIAEHIDRMLKRTTNAFLDERFVNGNADFEPGEAPLQKRVVWLLKQLGLEPRDVCASNLIFQTSRDANGLSFGLAGICWPLHEALIEIVKPRLLITFGNGQLNSPYAFLKELFFDVENTEESFEAGHGKWRCKGFQGMINGYSIYIVGLPHLSLYDPTRGNTRLIEWLKEKL